MVEEKNFGANLTLTLICDIEQPPAPGLIKSGFYYNIFGGQNHNLWYLFLYHHTLRIPFDTKLKTGRQSFCSVLDLRVKSLRCSRQLPELVEPWTCGVNIIVSSPSRPTQANNFIIKQQCPSAFTSWCYQYWYDKIMELAITSLIRSIWRCFWLQDMESHNE